MRAIELTAGEYSSRVVEVEKSSTNGAVIAKRGPFEGDVDYEDPIEGLSMT